MKNNENVDLNLERAILSACLNSEEAFNSISLELDSSDFSLKAHQDIYEAIALCLNAGEPLDMSFIKKHIKSFDENIFIEIIATNPIIDLNAYASELKKLSIRRKLLSLAITMPSKINDTNLEITEISEKISQEIFDITSRANRSDIKDMPEVIGEVLEELKKQKEAQNKEILGLDTGFKELNKITKGFKPGELIIIAARPSMGKTAICLNFIEKTLKEKKGVVLFSLEMPAAQIMQRMIASKTSISMQKIMSADLNSNEWERFGDACNDYCKQNFYIYDSGYASIADVSAVLRRLKNQDKSIELCVIDYIGLMLGSSAFKDRHLQVSEISRGLKLLARQLEIPIIALSQLNRSLESRANKRPMLSDLRESGAIEQDADTILFVYRDDVYREQEELERKNKMIAEGKGGEYKPLFVRDALKDNAELIVGKNRNGPTGTIELVYYKEKLTFVQAEKQFNAPVEISFNTNNDGI